MYIDSEELDIGYVEPISEDEEEYYVNDAMIPNLLNRSEKRLLVIPLPQLKEVSVEILMNIFEKLESFMSNDKALRDEFLAAILNDHDLKFFVSAIRSIPKIDTLKKLCLEKVFS